MTVRKLRQGDFWRVCERSGFRVPASETVREWTGAYVRRDLADSRHPQEFIKARRENLRVPDPRPPQVDVYVGPLRTEVTADASAGATTLSVLHTERFLAGDRIGLFLSGGDLCRAIVQSVDSSTGLTLAAALPGAVETGSVVTNYTAVATADIE